MSLKVFTLAYDELQSAGPEAVIVEAFAENEINAAISRKHAL